jgi:hypothetical protein
VRKVKEGPDDNRTVEHGGNTIAKLLGAWRTRRMETTPTPANHTKQSMEGIKSTVVPTKER